MARPRRAAPSTSLLPIQSVIAVGRRATRLLHLRAQPAQDEVVQPPGVRGACEGIDRGGAGHGEVVVGPGQG